MKTKRSQILAAAAVLTLSAAVPAYADPGPTLAGTEGAEEAGETEETETEADTEIEAKNSSLSQEDLINQYAEDLKKLEAEKTQEIELTEEEAAEGYRIVDGHKYAPWELEGDGYGEIQYGGVKPNSRTGYVNFIANIPEYIHEQAYVVVMNANTGRMYGCTLYEINGFHAQICLPSGIYIVSEGGLTADTTSRFYAMANQFQVKSGSQQDIIVDIVDAKPELAEKAYEEQETQKAPEEPLGTEPAQEEKEESTEKEPSKVLATILVILFTGIPAGVLAWLFTKRKRSTFRGFDQ